MLPKAIHVSGAPKLAEGFDRIRGELELPDAFPEPVLEEARRVAETAASDPSALPGLTGLPSLPDRTDLPLLTVDPQGSMDLDQALCIEQRARGYRVWYAIADVAAFVRPGGAIDTEARKRGETVYMPDGRVPLHPAVLSEGAASLLPGVVRPAALWCLDLNSDGVTVGAEFNGEPPRDAGHAAVAAPYAHVTAPLRRLVDRYAGEVCLAVAEGVPVPEPVQEALAGLPALMAGGGRRAAAVDRACVDLVEAFVLRDRVGQTFGAVVIDTEDGRPGGLVQIAEPAVVARCDGDGLRLGEKTDVRLTRADLLTREVRFTVA
ncbi:RNB domain-containing ribonuclease [Sphaerisporangium sp. NPDC051017]|uniref:RNB domain-containing ribonuclease n=1 Tax=Sphaerisporangium sp. NPDC051017 TaxID=3154636 RepID=UPI003427AB33